jgi:hypothetical protein
MTLDLTGYGKAVAILHSPNHFVPNHDFDTIELHESVLAAAESLRDRHRTAGKSRYVTTYIDGHSEHNFYSTMEGCYLKVWTPAEPWNGDPQLFAQEAHTLIHCTDRADFYIYLEDRDGETVAHITRNPKEGTR